MVHIFFAGILVLFLLVGSSARKGWVNIATLQFFGYISYGLYLIHLLVFRIYDRVSRKFWPPLLPSDGHFLLVVFRFLIAGGLAVGFAYLSRRYFEEAFLKLKDRFTTMLRPTLPPRTATCLFSTTESQPPEAVVAVVPRFRLRSGPWQQKKLRN